MFGYIRSTHSRLFEAILTFLLAVFYLLEYTEDFAYFVSRLALGRCLINL